MTEHDSRDHLVRKTLSDGSVMEYEVSGVDDSRTAAVLVFEVGDELPNISVRNRFDSRTGAEDAYSPEHYRSVVEIEDRKVSSLPDFIPSKDELNDFDRAAQQAAQTFASDVGIESEFSVAMPALMREIIDLSYDLEVDIAQLINDLGSDRPEHGRDDTPRLLAPYLKSLSAELGSHKEEARAALNLYVRESGIEGGQDPHVAMYHLIYGLIEVSSHEGIDFTKVVARILEESEDQPTPSMNP